MAKRIPLTQSKDEVSVLNSKFIALALPFSSLDDFQAKYAEFKKEYPKADHYPYAFILSGYAKSSDDGEPSGAAGKPILAYFEKKNIDQCLVMIARYFGGSKLGLPRLRKTFSELAFQTIENMKFGEAVTFNAYQLNTDYSLFEQLKKLSNKYGYQIENVTFSTKVELTLISRDTILAPLRAIGLDESVIVSEKKIEKIKEI